MKRWGTVLGIGGLLLLIYRLTLSPSLTWAHYGADGGDLATAVVHGSIPHPPGFPTYLLLGELVVRLPWGDPAWRLNLMSTVMAAGAAVLVVAAAQYAGSKKHEAGAICAGLCLGLAPLFWSQALITEVYAVAAFFAALVTLLALKGAPAWALGLAWGVGTGAHPTLLFLAPLVIWSGWGGGVRRLLTAGLLALLGWGATYGPVLLARGGVPSPWGDVGTFAGWWALVSGRLYHGYILALSLTAWPQRLLAWAALLARQFTPLGAVLAGLGWVRLWRERRALPLPSVLSFAAFSLYAIGYNTADSLVYLVPALPLAALWLGAGLAQIGAWLSHRARWGVWALLLLPLLQAALFWRQVDVSRERTATEWAEQVLQQAPPRAILLTARDAHTFTLWYAHDTLGVRPDVTVLDRDLWRQASYQSMMLEELGLEATSVYLPAEEAAAHAGRPVVSVTDDNEKTIGD